MGIEMCRADIMTAENDRQLREYKRERWGKEMKEAW
jgi:hypothetical protein